MLSDIGSVDDFEDGTSRIVDVNGRELAVVRWDDRFYAIRNICPHMGARLSAGTTGPRIVCEHPLEPMEADRSRPVLMCPWHGWSFDLHSGDSVFDPDRHRVRSYPIVIEGGRVKVDTGARRHAASDVGA